ncbi:uncharacterized protein LOC132732213 [Ruditapes philippinarum]|uniref:uncharacterized protein LOC132732213 n=1 Tax=Ruditapes philippinarum TaxID=129788 RepID=UPI00295B81BB|nr:uncharacterized protein LOC132732213 [Ruditapes philippinarum]
MTATYLHQTKTGHVTALDGTSIGDTIVLIAGLSTGSLIQITMKSLKSTMEVLGTTTGINTPIVNVHIQDEDTLYVLGSQHVYVYLYSQSNCSEFKSLAETMAGRNPFCGWCVFKQRYYIEK